MVDNTGLCNGRSPDAEVKVKDDERPAIAAGKMATVA